MGKFKKIISTVLISSLFVASVGCTQTEKKDDKPTTATETTTTTEETTENKTTESENAEPGWKTNSDKKVKLQWYINYSWVTQKWGDDPTSKKITELTGIDVEYIVPAGNEQEKLTTMIASGNLPDLLTMWWGERSIQDMISGEMIQPLNQLADEYDPYFNEVAVQERLNWYKQPDGNVYGYPNASYAPSDYEKMPIIESNQTLLVRKDIYEAIGSPNMSTPEGFLKALADAKEKFPTVDGQSLIPIGLHEFNETGNSSLQEYLRNFLAIPLEKDGILYDRETDPTYINWLKTFRKANELGLIAKDVFVDKRTQMEEKVAQKRYFAMLYQWTDCQAQNRTINATTPESTYIAVDGPKNENGDPHQLDGPSIPGWTLTMVSKNSKNPDRAIQLMSYLMSEEGQKYIWCGVEGQAYDMVDGKVVYKQETLDLLQNDTTAYAKVYGGNTTHWPMMDNPMAIEKGWQFPDPDFIKQIKEWTTPYATNNSVYAFAPFDSDSEEAISATSISMEFGKTLPQLIMAKSDEEFDAIWEKYIAFRDTNGFANIQEKKQVLFETNKEKLK